MSKIEKKATGIMVALYLPQHVAQQIMVQDGEPAEDLHVTLCYLPGIGQDKDAFNKIAEAILPVTEEFAAVEGRIGGIGRFNASQNSDGKDVYYASFNSPVLPVVQKMVVDAIEVNSKYEVSRDHGFTPHVTLKYIDTNEATPVERKASESFKIPKLSIASRTYQLDLPFSGARVLKYNENHDDHGQFSSDGDDGGGEDGHGAGPHKEYTTDKNISVWHSTNSNNPVVSTNPNRLISNSISTGTDKDTLWGENSFKGTLPKGSKVLEVDVKNFADGKTPLEIGRALRRYASARGIDAIKIKNVPGQGTEIAILNNKKIDWVKKDSPTGSQVHVPAPMGGGSNKKKPTYDDIVRSVLKDSDHDALVSMQSLVEGIDWESVDNGLDETSATETARANLEKDPGHYHALFAERNGNENTLAKSGLRLDLGSGHCREPGYVGFDLYPQDTGTVVHDLTLGIPARNQSAEAIRLVNSLAYMEGIDPSKLLGEVARTLKHGGQFVYEGPERLSAYPSQLELIEEANNADNLDESSGSPWFKQVFKRVVTDAATSDDAYPRLGEDAYGDLDTIVGGSALGYYWSDDTSSGQANRAYGYPSQGAAATLGEPVKEVEEGDVGKDHDSDNIEDLEESLLMFLEEEKLEKANDNHDDHGRFASGGGSGSGGSSHDNGGRGPDKRQAIGHVNLKPLNATDEHGNKVDFGPGGKVNVSSVHTGKDGKKTYIGTTDYKPGVPHIYHESMVENFTPHEGEKVGKEFPICKADKEKKIVYGVVLTPDEVDAQEDYMTAEDIEKAAHHFLVQSRTIGSQHEKSTKAQVVESYIVPQDMDWDGQYGPQVVKKGAWVLGVKITDPKEWQKVLDGEYQAFSVGGFGVRD